MAQYRNDEANDNLFIIFQKAPDFKERAAKEMLINLANTLEATNNELSQKIRRQMANLLSS